MKDMEFKITIPIDVKAKASEGDQTFLGTIEGFASTIALDKYGDRITEKAQRKASKQLLYAGTVFYNHLYHENPIGKVMESKYRSDKETGKKGIFIKVGISKTAPDKWTLIEEGVLKSFSIGGKMKDTKWEDNDGKQERIVNEMDLYEVSVVTMPANDEASFSTIAKQFIKSFEIKEEEEEVLEELSNISLIDFIRIALKGKDEKDIPDSGNEK